MEKHREAKLREGVKAKGGVAWKWVAPGVSGVPDRIVLMPEGKIYFVELKDGRNVLSPKQKVVHGILRKLGFAVLVIRTDEELKEFLDAI